MEETNTIVVVIATVLDSSSRASDSGSSTNSNHNSNRSGKQWLKTFMIVIAVEVVRILSFRRVLIALWSLKKGGCHKVQSLWCRVESKTPTAVSGSG